MLQRSLLTTAVAVLGLVAFALGRHVDVNVSVLGLGHIEMAGQFLIVVATLAVVLSGAWPTGKSDIVWGLSAALPTVLLTAGVLAALPALGWKKAATALAVALPVLLLLQAWSCAHRGRNRIVAVCGSLTSSLSALAVFLGMLTLRPPLYILGPATGLTAAALFLLSRHGHIRDLSREQMSIAAFLVGLCVAETSLPVGLWQVPPLVGALALLVVFYAATGLAITGIGRQANRLAIIEYSVLGLIAVAVVVWFVLAFR